MPRSSPGLPAVGRSDVGVRHDEVYAGTFSRQARCGVQIDMKPAQVKLLAGDIYKPAEATRRKLRFSTFSLRDKELLLSPLICEQKMNGSQSCDNLKKKSSIGVRDGQVVLRVKGLRSEPVRCANELLKRWKHDLA